MHISTQWQCTVCRFFVFSWVAKAVHLRKSGKLGELLEAVNTAISADVVDGRGPEFLEAMQQQIDDDTEVLTNAPLNEIIGQTNKLSMDVPHQDFVCRRNFNVCPDGWSMVGAFCRAPPSYKGPCGHMQALLGISNLGKEKFAEDCQAPWPCLDACESGRDYDVCPTGWSEDGKGFCTGTYPKNTNKICASQYLFSSMSIKEKQSLASFCHIEFPCLQSCVRNYDAICPEDWVTANSRDGLCFAPAGYAGDCVSAVNTTGWSTVEKKAFTSRCGAPYPCNK